MQAVHLESHRTRQVLAGNAGQRELAHDHFMPRKNYRGRHMPQSEFAQESCVIGAPGVRGLVLKIFNPEPAQHARARGPYANGGNTQRFAAALSSNFESRAASDRQQLSETCGYHGSKTPVGAAGGATGMG